MQFLFIKGSQEREKAKKEQDIADTQGFVMDIEDLAKDIVWCEADMEEEYVHLGSSDSAENVVEDDLVCTRSIPSDLLYSSTTITWVLKMECQSWICREYLNQLNQ